VDIDSPRIALQIDERGLNLARVFQRSNDGRTFAEKWRGRSATFALHNGRLTWRGPDSPRAWAVEGLALTATIDPNDEGWPQLDVAPGMLLDHYELTPEMCRDALKFTAPILANVTRASGRVSIRIDEVQAPLDDVGKGVARGTITFHAAEVGAGPLARELAGLLKIDPVVRIPDETTLHVVLAEGRVRHDALTFTLPYFQVRLSGSVGLDESLDLAAEVRLDRDEDELTDPADRAEFEKNALRVAIRGTLDKPKVDLAALAKNNLLLFAKGLQALRDRGSPVEGDERGGPADEEAAGIDAGTAIDALAPLAKEAAARWLERRKKKADAKQKQKDAELAPEAGQDAEEPALKRPRRRPLLRLLDGEGKEE
jgi:hypothetical protein